MEANENISWRRPKNRRVKAILQAQDGECGLACLAMVVSYLGIGSTLSELRSRFRTSARGSTLHQLISHAEKLGCETRAVRLEPEELHRLSHPAILHWEMGHYIVLESVHSNHIVACDPARGRRKISSTQVSASFTGVALEIWSKPPLQVRGDGSKSKMSALRSLSGAWTTLSQLLALTAVLEILGLTSPLLTQWLVDETGGPGGVDQVFTMGLAFLVLQIVQHGVTYLRTSIAHYFGCDLALTRKTGFLGQMLALPQSFFEMRSVGDVAAKFASVDAIQQSLLSAVGTFAIDGAVAIACLGIMLFYHSDLAAISLCSIACIAILRAVFFFRLRDLSSDQIEHSARSQTHLIETLRGVRVIQLFGKQKDRKKAWHNLLITQYNSMYRAMRIRSNVAQLCALISSFECISVLCFGAASVISGAWSTGALMAYAAYRTTFSSRASLLLDKILDLVMLRLHFDRLEDVIDGTKGESVAKRQEVTVFDASEGIHLNALTFRYAHGENTILRGASLSIGEGECIAFVGASGCGKTTLIKILLGTLQPTRGDVYIGGQSGDSLMSLSRLGLVAAVMQDDSLFAGSIEENIHCFDSDADLSQVTASAVAARIHDEIMAMPMGYMTLVGDMGSTLSGGQRQRIALARALYRRPKLLILDEATSHLDVANEKLIGEAIRELRITRILVAHRPETIASADRVIEIRNGELIEIRPKQL